MSIAQIAELDDWQIVNLFFRPGEEDEAEKGVYWPVPNRPRRGSPEERNPIKAENFKGWFFELWRWRGLSEADVEARWRKYLIENPGLAEQEAEHGS